MLSSFEMRLRPVVVLGDDLCNIVERFSNVDVGHLPYGQPATVVGVVVDMHHGVTLRHPNFDAVILGELFVVFDVHRRGAHPFAVPIGDDLQTGQVRVCGPDLVAVRVSAEPLPQPRLFDCVAGVLLGLRLIGTSGFGIEAEQG
jgi:hypothetical protein